MIAYILNLIDLALTQHILNTGGMEMNPAAKLLLRVHPMLFPVVKIFAAWVPCFWLEVKGRDYPAARKGLNAIAVFYGAVCLWNLINIAVFWAA